MGRARSAAVSALVLASGVDAFRTPFLTTSSSRKLAVDYAHVSSCPSCGGFRGRPICSTIQARTRALDGRRLRPRRQTAIGMVSEREEELKAKIARLRGAAAKGDSYERVVGKGAELTEKMEKSKEDFNSDAERAEQEKVRGRVVVRGKREEAVSELEAGRRTIVRDPDDPVQEANILDSLMVSKREDIEEELRAAYMPAGESSAEGRTRARKFDGAYGTTIQGAEAFFNKPSPFQKAAQRKAEEEKSAADAAAASAETIDDDSPDGAQTKSQVPKEDAEPSSGGEAVRLTGSVGGRWEKPSDEADMDTHKPAVSTWGVFARPKDISRAYGGGRDPTLKKTDSDEARRRDEETQAMLRSYRGTSQEDLERERENEPKIKAALAQSKRAMKFGDTFGAVSALEAVKQDCSTNGPLGATVFLELAMALEATGRSYQAQDIYKVLRRSRNRAVRAQAKRLNEGLEAMDMLKIGRPGEVQEESEISKMWTTKFQQMSGDGEKKYDSVYFEKDLDGRPKASNVLAVEDAKQVLLFASKYRGGISSKRIINAFEFLRKRSEEATLAAEREAAEAERQAQLLPADAGEAEASAAAESDETYEVNSFGMKRRRPPWEVKTEALPKGGAGLVSLLGDVDSMQERIQGDWTLVIKAGGSKVDVFQRDCEVALAPGGAVKAVEPAGPLSISKEGRWEWDASERVVKLDFESSKWIGLVDAGSSRENLEVLALDDKLLVAAEARREGAPVRTGAIKYRLLVRQ